MYMNHHITPLKVHKIYEDNYGDITKNHISDKKCMILCMILYM